MKRNRLANINEEEAMSKSTESSSTTGSVSSSSSSSSDEGSDGQKGSDSDTSSEEFFDAEEPNTGTMLRYTRKVLDNPRDRIDLTTLTPAQIDSSSSAEVFFSTPPPGSFSGSGTLNASTLSILSKSEMEEEAEEERRRKRLEEMRRRLNTDEIEEPPNDETSPSDSQTSSVEGLYGAISGKTSHPFKVVDHDTVSMQSGVSVGRMGRIMGNQSSSSNNFGTSASNHQSQHHSTHLPPAPMSISLPSSISTTQQLPIHPNFSPVLTPRTSNNSTTTTSSSSVSSEHVPSITKSATAPGISTSSTPESTRRTNEGNYINTCTKSAPEPDLVASCMNKDIKLGLHGRERGEPSEVSSQGSLSSVMKAPVAPPRRKRNKGLLSKTPSSEDGGSVSSQFTSKENTPEPLPYQAGSLEQFHNQQARRPTSARFDSTSNAGSALSSPNPPSPTVSIRSVCRDLDKTLESSIQKIFVVKAQDEVQTRAKSSGPKVLRRTESLPKDVIAAFDPSGTGSGGHRDSSSNSNSSTLTSSTNATMNPAGDVDDNQSLASETSTPSLQPALISSPSTIETPKSKSNSAPKTSNLSSVISAMAAMEEKHDHQFNLMIRTRTDSGKFLSDLEILEQVQVLNLDTGERVPLSIAEDKIPKCINPLSLHIMRLTSEYACERNKERDSDEESMDSKKSSAASQEDGESSGVRKKTAQVRRFLGSTVKKTVDKAKSLTQRRHVKEDVDTNEGILLGGGPDPLVKMKASHSHKGPYDFDQLQQVQDLYGEHSGPVWCMKFSNCGRLLATAGQDKIIRIWVLKDHLPYFQDMRTKNTSDKVSPTPSQESIVSQHSHHSAEEMIQACENSDPKSPFVPRPLCVYSGHTADLLDIAWSKSFFLLSSSMDRTVRLWHISRRECLCCFQHIDFVTAIAFHPRDDRYFLSGSLDGKLRLWNIPDKKVALWNEVNGPNNLITAANFCQNGKFAVVGTYDGRCIFYHTEQLKYHTQIIVHKRKRLSGRKITGIEPMPGEDKILVTSNDSRIRMYDLRDLSLTCKYKGFTNSSSQIKGTVSHDGKYIVSGSENQCVYIWKTNHDYSKFSSARRDRNGYWEGIKAHNAVVTSAVFAPDPDLIVKQIDNKQEQEADKQQRAGMVKSPSLTKSGSHQSQSHTSTCPAGYVLVSADFSGCIKVFFSKVKPKHSSLPASALV